MDVIFNMVASFCAIYAAQHFAAYLGVMPAINASDKRRLAELAGDRKTLAVGVGCSVASILSASLLIKSPGTSAGVMVWFLTMLFYVLWLSHNKHVAKSVTCTRFWVTILVLLLPSTILGSIIVDLAGL